MQPTLIRTVIRALDAVLLGRKRTAAMPEHLVMGKRGEEAAYFHLRKLGYVIVARNWRSRRRKGEIDLIGWDKDVLCFIEVKTRGTRDVKPAEAAVDRPKQRELNAMAREYLWRMSRTSKNAFANSATDKSLHSSEIVSHRVCRFDVVSIYYEGEKHEVTEITLFQNSFRMT